MSGYVDWIGAQADDGSAEDTRSMNQQATPQEDKRPLGKSCASDASWQQLPAHNFPGRPPEREEDRWRDDFVDRDPDLWLYRDRTVGLLRRYVRLALETGRLPSLIGRELFRARITSYTATSFEDRVIFVHDVEACLERLAPFDQKLIARVVLQEYDHERAARILHCTRKTIERRLPELLDELSEEFLKVRLLAPLPQARREIR